MDGVTIDVKSAFLYAPIGAEAKGRDERLIVKPPAFLTELGILKASDRWWVKKALYGLPTSPRDWGNYRDQEFRNFELKVEDQVYVFCQSKSDESLWFLRSAGETGLGATTGLLVVYVDDLAFSRRSTCVGHSLIWCRRSGKPRLLRGLGRILLPFAGWK